MPEPFELWRLTHPPIAGADPETDTEPEAPPTSDSPPPWGDDFDAQRAWNTITHLRGKEKELEPAAKNWQKLESGEDKESFRQLAEKFGYEIPEDDDEEYEPEPEDDEEYEDEDDPYSARLQAIEDRINERDRKSAFDDFMTDLSKQAKDRNVELSARETQWILQESLRTGFSPQATEKALDTHVEWLKERDKQTVESYVKSKRAPHVSPVGKEGTKQPNLDDNRERLAYMKQRFQELSNEG